MVVEGAARTRRRELPRSDARVATAQMLELAHTDPSRASVLARQALRHATAVGDMQAACAAERVLGLAARERHLLDASVTHLRRAVRIAERQHLPEEAALARMSLVGTLALRGDSKGALRQAALAGEVLHGVMRARLESQRARLHLHLGDVEKALDGYRRAIPVLHRGGDRLGEAHAYAGRGFAHYLRGTVGAAEVAMRRAEGLYLEIGETQLAASTLQHVALAVALKGDVPGALRCFDQADAHLAGQQGVDGMGLIDRSEVELAARLVAESRASAQLAVDTLTEQGEKGHLAAARLQLAQAALVAGDATTARRMAEEARAAFTSQRRLAWAAVARHVSVRAARLAGERPEALLGAARAAATHLTTSGFAGPSQDARLLAATIAIELGKKEIARRELALASRARHSGPVDLRVRAWHAVALLRLADGNRRGAVTALLAGVRLLEHYRAALGATELRAHASGHGSELTQLGLGLALADGDADSVLEWAERWRAGSLRLRPARPPDDARLAASLSELRAVVSELEIAALTGRPVAGLKARQITLEDAVRSRARHASGVMAAFLVPSPKASELKRALGDHALVEMVEHDGTLHAAVVVDGRTRLYRLGPAAAVSSELEQLRFSLRRVAMTHGSPRSRAAAADAVAFGAKQLDTLLLAPFAGVIVGRPLVIVPTGGLHALPWSILQTCAGRPLSVAPSASLWLRSCAGSDEGGRGDTVLVGGPGLPHAATEIAALGRRYPSARRLTGAGAHCRAVCGALDGADLAHVAAHGRFRADNPLFSSLQLADGPLTVYDLEALKKAPNTLILSACESGLSDVQPGDELMGLASAVFALGARALIASVCPVPDDATRTLMLALHKGLQSGLAPAVALSRAQTQLARRGHAEFAAASAFVCFGAGSIPDTARSY